MLYNLYTIELVDAIDSETELLVVVSVQYHFEFEQNFDINTLLYMILIFMKLRVEREKIFLTTSNS